MRVERICGPGRGIEPRDVITRLSADAVKAGKTSACNNFAVGLQSDCIYPRIRVRVEGGVKRAVGIQPGNAITTHGRPAIRRKRSEIATDQNLAVRLYHNCRDGT